MIRIFGPLYSITLLILQGYVTYVAVVLIWILFRCFRNHVVSKIWRVDLKSKYGPWAVVTGCTDGIGEQYAYEFAKRGMNIILISRCINKLKMVSLNIENKYGVLTEIILADFSEGIEIYKDIENKLNGKDIGILANIAGINLGRIKSFAEVTGEDIWGHLTINKAAPTYLTSIILPTMIKNKRGAIINVTSLAAMNPSPFAGIYSASKAYQYYFSVALEAELRDKGIFVQTVTPGYVATKLIKFTKNLQKKEFTVVPPGKYAAEAVATIGYANFTCGCFPHELMSIAFYIFPQWFIISYSAKMRRSFKFNTGPKEMK